MRLLLFSDLHCDTAAAKKIVENASALSPLINKTLQFKWFNNNFACLLRYQYTFLDGSNIINYTVHIFPYKADLFWHSNFLTPETAE